MPTPAAYCRVSSVEQVEGYSLDAQVRAAEDYCRLRGWPRPEVYADEGKSAYSEVTEKRPAFAAMLDAAEAGRHDVVIVHKLDRFARSLLVTLRELRRLERAGVAFVSIGEAIDFTTPIGRVILSVLAAFAQYYSDNLSTEVKKGLREKAAQGGHVGGVPWPAVRDAAGRLALDPARAEDLALLLDLATGRSLEGVAAELNRRGVRPPRGALWGPSTIHKVVRRGAWLLDQPAPWPDRWRAAHDRPRPPQVADTGPVPRPLSGLMVCGACGGMMQYLPAWTRPDGARDRPVRCRRCALAGVTGRPRRAAASVYEAAVAAWFLALPDLSAPRTFAAAGRDEARAALVARRRSLVLALAEGLPEAEYRRRKAALDREEAALPPPDGQVVALVAQLAVARAAWPRLTPAERNAVYRLCIDKVVITGRACAIVPAPALAAFLAAA